MPGRYFVITGYGRSFHARAFLAAVESAGSPPAAVIAVSPYSVSNIRGLLRRLDPPQLAAKIRGAARDLKGSSSDPADETAGLRAWAVGRNLAIDSSVAAFCARTGVTRRTVSSLRDSAAAAFVAAGAFDFGVYLGGGIVPAAVITATKGPVLNAHQGPLPAIRGMNAVEWSLFLGVRPAITVHAIDAGIDTGSICLERELDGPFPTLAAARSASLAASIPLLVEAVQRQRAGTLSWRPQDPAAGRQYFAMHPWLVRILSHRLSAASTE